MNDGGHVEPSELIATMKHFAEGGWLLNGEHVVSIAERADLNPAELIQLGYYALAGVENQREGGIFDPAKKHKEAVRQREMGEYMQVVQYVEDVAAQLAPLN